jgi:predicted porin
MPKTSNGPAGRADSTGKHAFRAALSCSVLPALLVLAAIPAPAKEPEAVAEIPDPDRQKKISEADNSDSSVGDDSARRADWETSKQEEIRVSDTETSTNEDPDAARRARRKIESERAREESATQRDTVDEQDSRQEPADKTATEFERSARFELYGSLRLHLIDNYDPETRVSRVTLADGISRLGANGGWQIAQGWDIFGRLEAGFDILDSFAAGGQYVSDRNIVDRLAFVGVESDFLYLKLGKSYSAYYTVAGETDRFSIFGANASGVYNAGTDGGATGTGRADQAFQTEIYLDTKGLLTIKPFNINLQYQPSQSIPHVSGEDYDYSVSTSAWLENDWEVGVGIAYHLAQVENPESTRVREAGIDGDARAVALAFRSYGDKWLASLVLNWQENIETTDEQRYINGRGSELFTQWQFVDNLWLVGGGNWLFPDDDDPDAGDYVIKYGVLGMRYTFDSFRRMVYFEWRDDHGSLVNGQRNKSEFTVGVRWDFAY